MSHKTRLIQWFSQRQSITPMEAMNDLGIYRLGARIYDLRKEGHRIETERMESENRYGEPIRPARYIYRGM